MAANGLRKSRDGPQLRLRAGRRRPGGGAALWGARELLAVGYGIAWAHTVNGVSRNNTLQFFRATARIPIAGPLGVGGGYWWYSRLTSYPGFFEPRRTQSEWRAFLTPDQKTRLEGCLDAFRSLEDPSTF